MLNTGYELSGPAAVRYPRGSGRGIAYQKSEETIEIGKSKTVLDSETKEVVILSFGSLLDSAIEAGKEMEARVVDMRFVKPLDAEFLKKIYDKKIIVTIEDGSRYGGAGSAVQEWYADNNLNVTIKSFGIPDVFIEHASRDEMIKMACLNEDAILDQINKLI